VAETDTEPDADSRGVALNAIVIVESADRVVLAETDLVAGGLIELEEAAEVECVILGVLEFELLAETEFEILPDFELLAETELDFEFAGVRVCRVLKEFVREFELLALGEPV
jgi:hypothetical protein